MANATPEPTRRDFLTLTSVGAVAVGGGLAGWSFIDYMNPSADVLALATTKIDLSGLTEGQAITVMHRGKPHFIRFRTKEEIDAAAGVEVADLRDPQSDEDRVQKAQYLVIEGVCTHLGCVPSGTKSGDLKGDFNGWFCPCHGSHYDTSGRIRKGPAPANLPVPPYEFVTDTTIVIG